MPIVKPHNWLYIEATLRNNQKLIQFKLTNNKLESYFYNKLFDNGIREQIDAYFYSKNL